MKTIDASALSIVNFMIFLKIDILFILLIKS